MRLTEEQLSTLFWINIAVGAGMMLLILVSLMVLARLLNPKDFGLVGMVTAF